MSQGNVDGIVEAIDEWRANPDLVERHGENAREAFERNFTTDASVDEYYELLSGN